MPSPDTTFPFDSAISRFLAEEAGEAMRKAIDEGRKRDIITNHFPYDRWMPKAEYEAHLAALQVELVKFKTWVKHKGERVVVIFEGRDTAGKSGAIARVRANMNPRTARIVALPKPTEREQRQWFFQRYVEHLPPQGELALMDRSWYNRAVIEHVFGFCTAAQREAFFAQLPAFEQTLVQEGVHLIKLWFNVSRVEQLRRMLSRESHVLKQWKLSPIDVQGLGKWDAYTGAIAETFQRSDFAFAPWTVILGDDKYRARLCAIQRILGAFDYDHKDPEAIGTPDPRIMGGPAIWPTG